MKKIIIMVMALVSMNTFANTKSEVFKKIKNLLEKKESYKRIVEKNFTYSVSNKFEAIEKNCEFTLTELNLLDKNQADNGYLGFSVTYEGYLSDFKDTNFVFYNSSKQIIADYLVMPATKNYKTTVLQSTCDVFDSNPLDCEVKTGSGFTIRFLKKEKAQEFQALINEATQICQN